MAQRRGGARLGHHARAALRIVRAIHLTHTSRTEQISRLRNRRSGVKKARGDLRGAIEIYRRLLTPDISSKWTAMLEPRYVLELARLLQQSGDAPGARVEYQRFLDLWKHADADLPEIAEARKALSAAGRGSVGQDASGRSLRLGAAWHPASGIRARILVTSR